MSGLVEFLRARLDEDAEVARNATGGPWYADHPEPKHWGDDPESALIVSGKVLCILDNQYGGPLNVDHIVRHDPSRVLAQVEAKRKILNAYEHWQGRVGGGEELSQFERGMLADLYAVCRILAEAEGWKP
jgi:hypothetical protein